MSHRLLYIPARIVQWLALAVLISALTFGCASSRWVPADPAVLPTRNLASDFFLRLLIDLRSRGYTVQEEDIRLGFLRVRAKTTAPAAMDRQRYSVNFFLIQLDPQGSLTIRPDGDLVRNAGTVMHRSFRAEFDTFTGVVGENLIKSRTPAVRPTQSL